MQRSLAATITLLSVEEKREARKRYDFFGQQGAGVRKAHQLNFYNQHTTVARKQLLGNKNLKFSFELFQVLRLCNIIRIETVLFYKQFMINK